MTVITTKKPFEEVLGALKDIKKIALVSCGSCAAMCQTGGTEGAKEMKEKLEKEGFEIKVVMVSEEICDNRVMKKDLNKINDDLKDSDAILTLSCGLGVSSIIEVLADNFPAMPVFVGTDTKFMGMTERIGKFYMRCQGCGECLLNETGGICPITACPKSLMNGPCGGMVKGKCEVGDYEEDCGWILIYNRLKELGQLDLFSKVRDSVDWSQTTNDRKIIWR